MTKVNTPVPEARRQVQPLVRQQPPTRLVWQRRVRWHIDIEGLFGQKLTFAPDTDGPRAF